MKISARQYAESLYDSVAGKSEAEALKVIKSFVALLGRQRALPQAAAIMENFQEIWYRAQGELPVELLSARALSPESRNLLLDYLREKTGAAKINLQTKIEADLLGGFILRYQSRVVDGSLRSSLASLKSQISN
jgi:F-type H+-transporting ATPase subunit delta